MMKITKVHARVKLNLIGTVTETLQTIELA